MYYCKKHKQSTNKQDKSLILNDEIMNNNDPLEYKQIKNIEH